MSSPSAHERQALLPKANDQGVVQEYGTADSSGTSTPSLVKQPIKSVSRRDLLWVLGGLWSAVFLGALDTTIVATLLSPIGSHFEKSHQASYLGTSYLLSVCCFTPLYGRLSDILGRKGAMLLALSLFGMLSHSYVNIINLSQVCSRDWYSSMWTRSFDGVFDFCASSCWNGRRRVRVA